MYACVTDTGAIGGQLVGVVTELEVDMLGSDRSQPVSEVMVRYVWKHTTNAHAQLQGSSCMFAYSISLGQDTHMYLHLSEWHAVRPSRPDTFWLRCCNDLQPSACSVLHRSYQAMWRLECLGLHNNS